MNTEKTDVVDDLTADFAAFPDASEDHPYLLAQPVRSHGLKQNGDKLIVPICEPASGTVVGWEEITVVKRDTGEIEWKKFTNSGTPKRGNGFLLGTIEDNAILIAEGYSDDPDIKLHTINQRDIGGWNWKIVKEQQLAVCGENSRLLTEIPGRFTSSDTGFSLATKAIPCFACLSQRVNVEWPIESLWHTSG